MSLKQIWRLLKETFDQWKKDKVFRLAAALSYYTIFSVAPLLIIVIAIGSSVFGENAARGEIIGQIQGLVGQKSAEAIQAIIQNHESARIDRGSTIGLHLFAHLLQNRSLSS